MCEYQLYQLFHLYIDSKTICDSPSLLISINNLYYTNYTISVMNDNTTDTFGLHTYSLLDYKQTVQETILSHANNMPPNTIAVYINPSITEFNDSFMFELNKEEFEILRTQFASSSWGGLRYMPMAFTEQGIAMLSSVLKSERAIAVNIQIVRLFTKMRNLLSENLNLKLEIEGIKKEVRNNKKNVEVVFSYLDELLDKKGSEKPVTKIGYKK